MMGIDSLNGVEPGDLYTTDGKDVWKVESFCEQPTITLVKMSSQGRGLQERKGGAVGCLNLQDFKRLVVEG